ncbi:MAG: alcohol dehydrogenase catalytic domain-containing protein [Clostridiales bacterium]|nr:alcohol dehydrogenase catalytic domain-containing protein [Clostridiales bacterium]
MKQIVMTGPRKSKVIDVPEPQIERGELLVKVTYTGMCHSEWYPWSVAREGETFGHETVGVVVEAGGDTRGFKAGDRVTGLGGGGYKEYIVMTPDKTVHVPDNLKDEDAIAEPLACLLSAAMKNPIETLGDSIAVVGAGYMGLGIISLFKSMGYGDIIAVDKREAARANALKFGATKVYAPEELPRNYLMNFDTIGAPDLTRDGHAADFWSLGFKNVVEFTGTEDGLRLSGDLTAAHGRLGIGGYHNDSLRSIDYKLWNFKAITTINCHERRIDYEAGLCQRCMMLLSRGIWKFTGVTNNIYSMEEFDRANEDMSTHANSFIKGAVRCSD